MMKTKRILNLAAVAAMMAACSNDVPAPAAVDHMSDTPIGFKPGISAMTTRAEYAAGELTAGTMGFYMQTAGTDGLDATTAVKYNGSNRKVECTNGKWTLGGDPLLWRNQTDEVTWQAYYPYSDENITDGILTITIPTDQQNDGVYDLLYGKGTTTGAESENGIDMTLKHMMSKFIVNIALGSDLGDAEIVSVVLTGLATQDKFNVSNAEVSINIGYFMRELEMPADINMIKHEGGKTFEAIVLPYTPSEIGLEITLTGGKKFYYKQGLPTFNEGQIHTLNLNVGKDKVESAKVEATDWTSQNGTGATE